MKKKKGSLTLKKNGFSWFPWVPDARSRQLLSIFKKKYTIRKASTIYLYAYTMMQISNFSLIKINNVIPLWLTKFKEYMYLFCKMSKSSNSCTKLGALVKHLLTNQTNQQTLMLMVLRHFRVLLSGVICNVSKKISSSILFTF